METQSCSLQERSPPVQYVRGNRAFRQFKNPPQPHMCIQDTIKDTTEKLYINVLGWQKIANPKHYSDPIPLYGGMQVAQSCSGTRPPLLVFAVMVNPDILKANGKNAPNVSDRDALVSLLCDFVEAMNPGLVLARRPVILKDRDLAGELKDVWLAVQHKREREKGGAQDVMYKVYDIDGIGNENGDGSDQSALRDPKNDNGPNTGNRPIKSSKQILMNAGQKSEFDSGMNNTQINQNKDNIIPNTNADITYCTPMYGQIVSTREDHNQINDIQHKLHNNTKPSSSFRKDYKPGLGKTAEGWDEFSKRSISTIKSEGDRKCDNIPNGKQYDFFPIFDNKNAQENDHVEGKIEPNCTGESNNHDKKSNEQLLEDNSKIIIVEPMQKLVLHQTDSKICDNKASTLSS